MKNSFQNKAIALVVAVLLLIGMSPVAFAERSKPRGIIKFERPTVKLEYGAKITLEITYDDNVEGDAIGRAFMRSDKPNVATVEFGRNGSDLSSAVITAGEIDGTATIELFVGNSIGKCVVTVGRGNKTPEQIKKEEAAAKTEKNLIENDKSELGLALAEAIKKTSKKDVTISTTTAKTPSISAGTMKALAARANQANKRASLRIDAIDANGKLKSRMLINPEGLTRLKSDFKTGVTVDTSRASLGSKYVASVKCEYTGSFMMFAEIAVRVNAPQDISKLSFYNVDANGKLRKIEEPTATMDKNGLLNFYTKMGGEIVIVNGTL